MCSADNGANRQLLLYVHSQNSGTTVPVPFESLAPNRLLSAPGQSGTPSHPSLWNIRKKVYSIFTGLSRPCLPHEKAGPQRLRPSFLKSLFCNQPLNQNYGDDFHFFSSSNLFWLLLVLMCHFSVFFSWKEQLWSLVDYQHSVSFMWTAEWFGYTYTCIPFQILFPCRLFQCFEQGSLYYI